MPTARRGPTGPEPDAIRGPSKIPDFPFEHFIAPKVWASEEERLKSEVDSYNQQISGYKGRIKDLQDRINGAKNAGLAWMVPGLQAELDANNKELGQVLNKFSEVQNKYWETSGQYDKLLAGSERDAFMAVNALFKNYGLDTLAPKIFDYIKNGYSADTISVLLQDTNEYKQRFIGNEARKKAGLPVLSPAEYLATESAYRQVMESAGLPKGFYDQPKDFADFLGKNVSPTEVQDRVNMAVRATTLADDNIKQALKQMGLGEGEMVAYWLDKDKSLPLLKQALATAEIGSQALGQGLSFNQQYSEALARKGITGEQAAQGYSAIASELQNLSTLGSIYGAQWNQRMSEQAMFEGNATALDQKRRLASQERGAFSGSVGSAKGGLAQRGGQR
jgi:hypothetical protein